jgi:hypothetical protein
MAPLRFLLAAGLLAQAAAFGGGDAFDDEFGESGRNNKGNGNGNNAPADQVDLADVRDSAMISAAIPELGYAEIGERRTALKLAAQEAAAAEEAAALEKSMEGMTNKEKKQAKKEARKAKRQAKRKRQRQKKKNQAKRGKNGGKGKKSCDRFNNKKKVKRCQAKKRKSLQRNLLKKDAFNRKRGKKWKMRTNWLFDMDDDEIKETVLITDALSHEEDDAGNSPSARRRLVQSIADSIDWADPDRAPVRNQGQCGSCYAYGAVSLLQLQRAKESDDETVPEYSAAQAKACVHFDWGGTYGGCNGGAAYKVLNYLTGVGASSETVWPDDAEEFPAFFEPSFATDASLKDCDASKVAPAVNYAAKPTQVQTTWSRQVDEDALIDMLQDGPVVVSLDSSGKFGMYGEGIFDDCIAECYDANGRGISCNNHQVLLVGYGTEGRTDYWKIQNSWGDEWGEEGYMRLARDAGNLNDACGMYFGSATTVSGVETQCAGTWTDWSECSGCDGTQSREWQPVGLGCEAPEEERACGEPCPEVEDPKCFSVTGTPYPWALDGVYRLSTVEQNNCGVLGVGPTFAPAVYEMVEPEERGYVLYFYNWYCSASFEYGKWAVGKDQTSRYAYQWSGKGYSLYTDPDPKTREDLDLTSPDQSVFPSVVVTAVATCEQFAA